MVDRVVVIFAEGPTEIEFYKAVVIKAREIMKINYTCQIEYIDMKGIGNYKKDALRKFNNIKKKKPNNNFSLFLCIDNDVFEYSKKPPIDKEDVKQSLLNAGAKDVTYIMAKQSIEEWFLYDLDGVLNYLRLSKDTKKRSGKGQEALKKLFLRANKVYVKGSKVDGFIEKLDIQKIIKSCCDSLKPLCSSLGLDCKIVCGKK